MLKFNPSQKKLEELQKSDFKKENILERYDLQQSIVNSWEVFRGKIGIPNAYLIGQEIRPHNDVGNAIDLLAYEPYENSLYVIELKRDKNKLQLLQALSYAAMVSGWNNERIISEIQTDFNPEPEELIDFLKSNEQVSNPQIILIAEAFDPEVLLTAQFLHESQLEIFTAFAVKMHKLVEELFIDVEQRFPVKELSEMYEKRGPSIKKQVSDASWDDVRPKLTYDFGNEILDFCLKEKEGDAGRRRFIGFRTNFKGFKRVDIHLRYKHVAIGTVGLVEDEDTYFADIFREPVDVSVWGGRGYSFVVDTRSKFEDLVEWLGIS